jgi:CxxC motif-containing protein (DUF1111 family)
LMNRFRTTHRAKLATGSNPAKRIRMHALRCSTLAVRRIVCAVIVCAAVSLVLASDKIFVAPASAAQPSGETSELARVADNASAIETSAAYSQPLAGLSAAELREFAEGKAEFSARWVAPFLSGGEWGLGPQSNAASCIECHPGNGRGRAPDGADEAPQSLVLQLALRQADSNARALPHPAYGTHLNRHGTLGKLIEEGQFRIAYHSRKVKLADGEIVELRVPDVRITALWFGPLGHDTVLSPRIAQPVFGLGLLEAVPESTLFAIAERQRDLGFNGRVNLVRDKLTGATIAGRFGHKATEPHLSQQIAAAFHDEMGVTSELFPDEQCWPLQEECFRIESVLGVEAKQMQLATILDYLRMLAAPPRRAIDDPQVRRGAALFADARCSICHVPSVAIAVEHGQTGRREYVIEPYTDLLLHDMGDDLADGYRSFSAGEGDWRTAPLWGLGLRAAVNGNNNLLHDGRARSVSEAILWHGGEAEVSRQAFIAMERHERQALLRFLDSL